MKSPDLAPAPSENDVETMVTDIVALTMGKNRWGPGRDESIFSIRDHIDSFALLELVLRLEEAFGIRIEDNELDPDHFESIRTISEFVSSKQRRER